MKIIKTLNLSTENINIYTVRIRKGVLAEVVYRTDKNLFFVAAVTDNNGDLVDVSVDENAVVEFLKKDINK